MSNGNARTDLTAVFDTNLNVSGTILPDSLPGRVLSAWVNRVFSVITSERLVTEAADVLARDHIQARYQLIRTDIDRLLASLRAAIIEPLPLDALPVHCRDPEDDPVLACALPGDAGLLALDRHPALGRLRSVTPRAFFTLLGEPSI